MAQVSGPKSSEHLKPLKGWLKVHVTFLPVGVYFTATAKCFTDPRIASHFINILSGHYTYSYPLNWL